MEKPLISVELNGEKRELPAGLNLETLLAHLEIAADRVAIEHNRVIVRRSDWAQTALNEGDEVEVVMFVGGGSSPR